MRRTLARALLLALPAIGLGELGAHFWFASRPPAFEEWKEARGAVAAFRKADEPVVVAPRWAEPLARQAFGDEAFPIAQVARADVDRFERAVEISILGERAPELAGWAEEAREEHGKLVFRRLRNPGYRAVVTDFVELARPPSAEVRTTEPEEVCRWNPRAQTMSGNLGGNPTFAAQRFECPSGVFFNVGATVIADEEFRPRRCLWAHPPRRGEIVTRFHGVRLGETIEGHGGIYWMIEREKKGAPVTIAVRVDGEEIGRVTHADGEGWARFDLPLGRHARAEGAEVEFGVSSADHRHRHFCFEATSR